MWRLLFKILLCHQLVSLHCYAVLDVDAEWRFATGTLADAKSITRKVPLTRVEKVDAIDRETASGRGMFEDFSTLLQTVTSYFGKSEPQIAEVPTSPKVPNLVTIFSAACSTYHDWQSVVLHHSWRHGKLPGRLVRLLACEPHLRQKYNRFQELGDEMRTHIHDDKTHEAGQSYPPLNKPWGIHSWLTEGSGHDLQNDTVVLIVDPDMAFKLGEDTADNFMPLVQRVQSSGEALGLDYSYVRNGMRHNEWQLPLRFLPEERLPFLQSIGPPMLIRKDKLAQLAREWHDITLSIVKDPEMHGLVHDGFQPAPWIAEMYGYSLAAAKVFPRSHETQSQWPALQAPQPPWPATGSTQGSQMPLILHYSHPFNLCGKKFGKNLYAHVDLLNCSISALAFDEMLRPPTKEQVTAEECKLCLGSGDVIGFDKPACLNSKGKPVSFAAWAQVYAGLKTWRNDHCALRT